MKKHTFLSLAVAMSFATIATANPFSDVPTKHWAPESVAKLEKAGIVDGDGLYHGDRILSFLLKFTVFWIFIIPVDYIDLFFPF